MTKEIKLTQGKVALVDDEDFEELSKHKWYANKISNIFYAMRNSKKNDKCGRGKIILMHREIINTPQDKFTDHINGSGLDNRKNNLRICTNQQNIFNSKIRKNNKCGYKGVRYKKNDNKTIRKKPYESCIQTEGRLKFLGYYKTKEEAARVYNQAALKYHGEFARLNIIK